MKSRPPSRPQLEISLTFLIFHLSCVFSSDPALHITQTLLSAMNDSLRSHDFEYSMQPQDPPNYNPPRLMIENEVWSFVEDAISRRTRRQSSHKRRHKLLLKSRIAQDRGRKSRRQRKNFNLKSDSEGHVITSATQVRKDWCRTVPFWQNIALAGCQSKEVKNNFCYGQCNSFFIPQHSASKEVAFQSYSNCMPDRIRWANVTLDCSDRSPASKTVLFVESCRCTAMEDNLRHHRNKGLQSG